MRFVWVCCREGVVDVRLKAFHRVETWSCGVPSSRETDIGLKSHILDTSASAAAMKGKVLPFDTAVLRLDLCMPRKSPTDIVLAR